jgi:NAD(P)-dependent dehydrogenase (short-subunit alcohol dehydrogenase family)
MEFAGKLALVTGATSGIGQAVALKLAREGAYVAIAGRNQGRLDELKDQIAAEGGRALTFAADLAVDGEGRTLGRKAAEGLGGLDVLVNAAGILASGTLETTSMAAWDEMMNINLRSVFELMQACLPALSERKGNIVNVSSVTGPRAFPGVLAYCVSKAAVDQLTRCAALELGPRGVRVNAVNPGVIVTDVHKRAGMDEAAYEKFLEHSKTTHPLGRVGQATEVADLVAFLASDRAGFITGTTMCIDGGRSQTCLR